MAITELKKLITDAQKRKHGVPILRVEIVGDIVKFRKGLNYGN